MIVLLLIAVWRKKVKENKRKEKKENKEKRKKERRKRRERERENKKRQIQGMRSGAVLWTY